MIATEIDMRDDMPPSKQALADDWDEASIRARAAADTERAVEDAQPGKTEEIEVPRSKVNTNRGCLPGRRADFCPSGAQRRWPPLRAASAGTAAPHVVLKIRRRKFNQQSFTVPERLSSPAVCSVPAKASIC